MRLFSRRNPRTSVSKKDSDPPSLGTGVHRSPGLALLAREMEKRQPRAILDFGPSSTETVEFLSQYCDNISIQDLFQSSQTESGSRATLFQFDPDVLDNLPKKGELFDAVLVWDLLHYFERSRLPGFVERLAQLCHPDALVFLLASSSAAIPMVPILFKIHDHENLHYTVQSGDWAESPQLKTRDVEQILVGFEPVRLFQLRNGLQGVPILFLARSAARASCLKTTLEVASCALQSKPPLESERRCLVDKESAVSNEDSYVDALL